MDDALLRIGQLSTMAGVTAGLVVPRRLALGGVSGSGTTRRRTLGDCAERKARGNECGNQRPKDEHHALNVVGETPAGKGGGQSPLDEPTIVAIFDAANTAGIQTGKLDPERFRPRNGGSTWVISPPPRAART